MTGSGSYFSSVFNVDRKILVNYGALDVSLINDLPLFVDPFLLFNSEKPQYRKLHEEMIAYLRFLWKKAEERELDDGSLEEWFTFREVKQNWLGFSKTGNAGSGLGTKFAKSVSVQLGVMFTQSVAKGEHIERLCLLDEGVGRDSVSDFTTNLIKKFLLQYTSAFAQMHIDVGHRREMNVRRTSFNYQTETWQAETYDLPVHGGDFVLLTPRELLTKDDTWINRHDLLESYADVVSTVSNNQLRAKMNNYIEKRLEALQADHPREELTKAERRSAATDTLRAFPALMDYYIKYKEDHGGDATAASMARVENTEHFFIEVARQFQDQLHKSSSFYELDGDTLDETRRRVAFLKQNIENNDGYRLFYGKDGALLRQREEDIQLLFRLTWFDTRADVNREVNNGRGPVDYKVSQGARDKTLVEFKLAANSQLEKNLKHQVEVYAAANETNKKVKVILFFSYREHQKVLRILERLQLGTEQDVVLIDARADNKPSGSKT